MPDPYNLSLEMPDSTTPAKRYFLLESCLKKFLKMGRLEKSATDVSKYGNTQLKEIGLPQGLFFTSKQEVFYWRMINEHFLEVWDREGHRATVGFEVGCRPVEVSPDNKFLTPPRREDVVAIISTNNINYDRAPFQDHFNEKLREAAKRDPKNYGDYPPPPPRVEDETLFRFLESGTARAARYPPLPFGSSVRPNGGLVLRDRRILYFELVAPKLLFMEAEYGASCVIRLN